MLAIQRLILIPVSRLKVHHFTGVTKSIGLAFIPLSWILEEHLDMIDLIDPIHTTQCRVTTCNLLIPSIIFK